MKDGCLVPASNQFLALSPTTKYSIVAKGERIVVTYILLKPEHIASHQRDLLNKKSFPVPAFAYPVRKRLTKKGPDPYEEDTDVKELRLCADETMDTKLTIPSRLWEQHERDGHMPKFPDCPVCVQEHGSVVKHFSSTTNSLHTLHLETVYWGDPSLDGKRYFLAAGLRVQHEDKIMLAPFFIPVENKTGLTVSLEVFQLAHSIATRKQLQAFHGSRVLRILSDQNTEFVNQEFEKHSRQRGILGHITSTSTTEQRCSREASGSRQTKQCTRRLLLVAGLPDFYWSYAMRFAAEMFRHISSDALSIHPQIGSYGKDNQVLMVRILQHHNLPLGI